MKKHPIITACISILFSLSSHIQATSMLESSSNNIEKEIATLNIIFASDENEKYQVKSNLYDTVATLQNEIQEETDYFADCMQLKFKEKLLEKERKLCSYQIKNGSTIFVHEISKNFPTFQASNLKNTKNYTEDNGNGSYYGDEIFVAYGMSLFGICKNQQCDFHEKEVTIPKYFGTFFFPQVIAKAYKQALCPCCKEWVEGIQEFGFSYCKYEIIGEKEVIKDGKQTKEAVHHKKEHTNKKGCTRFLAGGDKSANYYSLQITVTKHENAKKEGAEEKSTEYIR